MSGLINQVGARSGIISGGGSTSAGTVTLAGTTGLDYEDGEWTAQVTDGTNLMTMQASLMYYTKIGNLVTVTGNPLTSSIGSASGPIKITGLPFTIANNNAAYPGGTAGYGGGFNLTAGNSVCYYGRTGYDEILLMVWDSTSGVSAMQASEWTNDGDLVLSLSYRVA